MYETKVLRENFGSHTGKAFNIFSKKDSCTWNTTYNTVSVPV